MQSLCKWVYLGVWCLFGSLHFDFLFKIIWFWLHLIFIAAQGLPLVVCGEGRYSSLQFGDLFCYGAQSGGTRSEFSSWSSWALDLG